MNSFKDIAYQILKEASKPLHSKEITKIALNRGWLKTAGKTPEATMNAQLITDINKNKKSSRFVKIGPSKYSLNKNIVMKLSGVKYMAKINDIELKKKYAMSPNISTKQKGDIAEARIAELITLYGKSSLSCYKPISDDDGIDIIVKQKGSLKTMYIQVKSRFGERFKSPYVGRVKKRTALDNYSMAIVFCFFDTDEGDLWDHLWFIPMPVFIKQATVVDNKKYGPQYNFVAGKGGKWEDSLIDKQDLANKILEQMERL